MPEAPGLPLFAEDRSREFLEQIKGRSEEFLKLPQIGITTNGQQIPGLFPVQQTGISTASIREAAEAFIRSLDEAQRVEALFPIDAAEWAHWANPMETPNGTSFGHMSDAQREAGLALIRASLSEAGFETIRNAMKLNHSLGEIIGDTTILGEWRYSLLIFGTPSEREPWGWQIQGHHIIVNCFVLGDQLVFTPNFLGAEPAIADRGKYAGTQILAEEERSGLELVQALTPAQQAKAILFHSTRTEDLPPERFFGGDGRIEVGAFKDNIVLPYEGLPGDELSAGQQELLMKVVQAFIGRIRPGHAEIRLEEIRRHLPATHFAWMGGTEDDSVFFFKVHNPVVLIEFDHQRGVFLDNDDPQRFHIHSIVRTPNGNDYGRDLLRQHYQVAHARNP
jgi:hypothetical protein